MILFVDVLVHDWLCEHWIVTFIVAVATVANLKLFVRGQLDHEKEVGIYDKYTQAYLPFLQNCLNFLDPFTPKISPVAFLTVCHKFRCISCKVFQTAATPCVSAGLYSCGRRFEIQEMEYFTLEKIHASKILCNLPELVYHKREESYKPP